MEKIYGQEKAMRMIKLAFDKNLPALLIGETGSGKTSMIQHSAEINKKTAVRFNLTGETTVDEFVGKYVLEEGETKWQDGILLTALRNGWWLIVDEVNMALPEILATLHSLLDHDKNITLAQKDNEVVKAHDDFRFFATMNPVSEYAGTKELNKAFKSRFPIILTIDYAPNRIESQILQKRTGIEKEKADMMVMTAQKIRDLKKKEELFYTCSTRDLIYWAELSNHMSIGEAFEYTIANKSEDEGEEIMKIFESVFGKIEALKEKAKVDTLDLKKIEEALLNIISVRDDVTQEIKALNFERDSMRKKLESELNKDLKEREKEIVKKEAGIKKKKAALDKQIQDLEEKLKVKMK